MRCVFCPSATGSGCKTRLESRFFSNLIIFMFGFQGQLLVKARPFGNEAGLFRRAPATERRPRIQPHTPQLVAQKTCLRSARTRLCLSYAQHFVVDFFFKIKKGGTQTFRRLLLESGAGQLAACRNKFNPIAFIGPADRTAMVQWARWTKAHCYYNNTRTEL